jgi:hypothetical protein
VKWLLLLLPLAAQAQGVVLLNHHDAAGQPVAVAVTDQPCPYDVAPSSCYVPMIYVNGNYRSLPHELAHVAGMLHTPWNGNSFGNKCARVTVAGYRTGYKVGDEICIGFDGSDINYSEGK